MSELPREHILKFTEVSGLIKIYNTVLTSIHPNKHDSNYNSLSKKNVYNRGKIFGITLILPNRMAISVFISVSLTMKSM